MEVRYKVLTLANGREVKVMHSSDVEDDDPRWEQLLLDYNESLLTMEKD